MAILRRDSSVGFFEELYAVVVGLGLALAIEQVIDLDRSGLPVRAEHVVMFLAYLNLAFAHAHASVRYLQLTYSKPGFVPDKTRVVADLVLGVGHFLWLITLSFLITRPVAFAVIAIVMLIGRPVRDLVLRLGGREWLDFDRKVATVHLVTIGLLAIGLGAALVTPSSSEDLVMRSATIVASLVFGLGVYLRAYDHFFPATNDA